MSDIAHGSVAEADHRVGRPVAGGSDGPPSGPVDGELSSAYKGKGW